MLYFFLDDSGTDDRSPVITMAGYVVRSHHWAIFDKRAKKLDPRYGITKLHASEFHGTKGEFASWTGDKKMEFVRELFTLVRKSCVLGVSASVLKAGYKAAVSGSASSTSQATRSWWISSRRSSSSRRHTAPQFSWPTSWPSIHGVTRRSASVNAMPRRSMTNRWPPC
jgi:hypothetical protein